MMELILLFGPPILSLFGGVFISCKVIQDKEAQRAKECMEMEKGLLYFSKIGSVFLKIFIGGIGVFFLFLSWILFIVFVGKHTGIFFIFGFAFIWIFARIYPLFAITNESFILWNYYGFASLKRYELRELSRTEFDYHSRYGTIHFVELYRRVYGREKRINSFISNAYDEESRLLELLRQIQEKQDS